MAGIGADASTSIIALIPEVNWAEDILTPELHYIRSTGNGLGATINKAASDEITANRGKTDAIMTTGGAEGDINFEPSYGYFMDRFWEQALSGFFDEFGVLNGGSECESMFIERQIPVEGGVDYYRYKGSTVNSLALTLDAEATNAITGTINVMARSEDQDTAIIAGATYTAANENPVMSMPEMRVVKTTINSIENEACFKTLGLTINANTRMQQGKCTGVVTYPDIFAKGIGYGDREITTNLGYYYSGPEYDEMFKQNTSGTLSYILSDGTRGYKVVQGNIKIMESGLPVEGSNSDLVQAMVAQAFLDSDGVDISIEKIASLEAGAGIKLTEVTTTPSPDFTGTFYKDGTLNDTKDVYASIDGLNAIWWSTADVAWAVTLYGDIGTFPVAVGWENTNAADPTGTWDIVGTATGDMSGAAYDPTA